jgi:hypothetical protein
MTNANFKNENAKRLYSYYASKSSVYEHGIDNNGMIYFAHANGNIDRYTRAQFIKKANELYQ